MRLQLRITKHTAYYETNPSFLFSILDLDKGKKYPLNFVCVLPESLNTIKSRKTRFSEIFGKNDINVAKKLLVKALKNEDYAEFKLEIERRLQLFDQPMYKKECISCGEIFLVKHKRRLNQGFCENCIKRV